MTDDNTRERRRIVVVAGHAGDLETVGAHANDEDAAVRVAVLNAFERNDALDDSAVIDGLSDPAAEVRRRSTVIAARRPHISLLAPLNDPDSTVVEVAAWACGEQVRVSDEVLERLIELAGADDDPLVREASAAALGAIGDPRGLPAVLAACIDKPHIRRRAVLALAPFNGDEVEAMIDRALDDRDWQVRQAAEDLRRAAGEVDV